MGSLRTEAQARQDTAPGIVGDCGWPWNISVSAAESASVHDSESISLMVEVNPVVVERAMIIGVNPRSSSKSARTLKKIQPGSRMKFKLALNGIPFNLVSRERGY